MTIVQAAKSNTKKKNTSSSSSSSASKSSSSGTGGTVIGGVTYGTGNGGYMADIQKAVADGNYKLAAQLEQARNNVIDSTGSSYSKTNNLSGWLDNTDYGTIGKQQMASGASAEDVYQTYLNRYNKANGTVGLQQYANDDIQQEMWDYIQANLNKPTFNLEDYLSGKPTYNSQYSSRIDDMLNQLLNRDKFSYNAMNDPLYQQYASMYNREGNRAMNDTLASAAANAGGMNSYAVTAAQQANDYYSSQLNDKIPELYQMAYSMYMDDIDNQVRDLGLLQDMDSTQYNRYRDTMSDWRNDLSFAYNMYRDNMGDWQWDKTFDYNAGRDQLSDSRYESETAYNRALDFLSAGIMPNQDVLDAAGLTENDAANLMAQQLVGGSGGSGGYVGGGETDWDSMFQEAMNSKNPESWLRQKKNFRKYGLSSAPSYNDYLNWLDGQNEITSASQLGTEAMRIANQMSRVTSQNNYQYFADQIQRGVDNGTITEYEADFLLKAMGY